MLYNVNLMYLLIIRQTFLTFVRQYYNATNKW